MAKITDAISATSANNAITAAKYADAASIGLLRQIANEVASGELPESKVNTYARAIKLLKESLGLKSDLDRREQEARIDMLKKQAEKDDVDHNTMIAIDDELEDYAV